MSAEAWFIALDWTLRVAALGAVTYCVRAVHLSLARIPTPADVERCVDWRLFELLPLPYLGDRGTLLELLRNIAPGQPRAVFALTDTPLLLVREGGSDAPTPADARWIELHRATLARGEHVHHTPAGTLLPLLTRGGRLSGAIVVAGRKAVALDDESRAALRCIAGWLDRGVLADARARERVRRGWEDQPTPVVTSGRAS